jgi:hypothetical protein
MDQSIFVLSFGTILFSFLLMLFFMTLEKKEMNIGDCLVSADRFLLMYGVVFDVLGIAFSVDPQTLKGLRRKSLQGKQKSVF